ncbi:metallophosphoesterase family protein [Chitinimonas sp. BJB300]|uniref:metallophosphoesterase family protein n=1 Tax=Chitinimonas sp. BJB300 TaxID=1559339 RepID=UPI000C1201A0|nr:metallophosphoesterase [Chitinimonas sp. BJB300]PHV11623.1 metallophosphatase family protein [Chitinimonas sp. BJB300]TSJ85578.1 metallophosphoesterase [Chitinimonas sp. BJB300]
MLLAILTDIHANRPALSACFEDAAVFNPGRYIFLGDYVGYGAEPEWVLDTIMRFVAEGAIAVRGNHDAAATGTLRQRMRPDAQAVIDWTKPRLTARHIEFLNRLPLTAELAGCYFAHANPWEPEEWDYILTPADASFALAVVPHKFIFCGHAHDPALYSVSNLGKASHCVPQPGQPLPLDGPNRWLAIPGSAGQPRDGNTAAAYALFDTDTQVLTYRRVPYDTAAATAVMRAAGLPEVLAQRLERAG